MDSEKQDLAMQSGDKKPFLAVWMVTYNHEAYIEKAVESVMRQQTNFNFKLFIGEDNSSDSTASICKDLKEKYPNEIQLFLNEMNIGANRNAFQIYEACNHSGAKYIALLEGDDYWTDNSKLQKQVDFLEQNQECIFCFHTALVHSDAQEKNQKYYPKDVTKELLDAGDFFQITTISTASVMYRNFGFLPRFNHSHGDFLLYCELLSKGKAGYINEIMSSYRLHEGGISSAYNSNVYLEKRIDELQFESKVTVFSAAVKSQIGAILTEHILHYLNKNRNQLTRIQKRKYATILIHCKGFYSLTLKSYSTLFRTLLK